MEGIKAGQSPIMVNLNEYILKYFKLIIAVRSRIF